MRCNMSNLEVIEELQEKIRKAIALIKDGRFVEALRVLEDE